MSVSSSNVSSEIAFIVKEIYFSMVLSDVFIVPS